ncbi:hypothetical protein EII29_09800 [Leptotrichia sp. OH3620_COT-345]|uniref:hypothetical protein n=1 Tax=Leptotrichia sp. OH3620_COT-345 TaxID=2491048 RepID=UPI000F654672|nr:hypothetical protein [Leptotrichia sp. OH3620_COT-345]RRD38809.1 hypothetical protein EII29_09800 [Leptotrichia sp. OH3620_COT-345]
MRKQEDNGADLGILIIPETNKSEIEYFRNNKINLYYEDEKGNRLKDERYFPDRRDIWFDKKKYEKIYGKDNYGNKDILSYKGKLL